MIKVTTQLEKPGERVYAFRLYSTHWTVTRSAMEHGTDKHLWVHSVGLNQRATDKEKLRAKLSSQIQRIRKSKLTHYFQSYAKILIVQIKLYQLEKNL